MNCNYKVKITDIQNKYQFKILCKGGANSTNVNDIYNLLPTTTTENTNITISNTADIKAKAITIKGNTTQDGTPTPTSPVDVLNVTGLNTINVSNSDSTQTKAYTINLGSIELCKIGTYQDYLYKENNKWYKYNAIKKVTWNGSESWDTNPGISTTYVIARPTDLAQANNNVFYNYFSTVADLSSATEGARIGSSINLKNPNTANISAFKTWLGTNNVTMYYQSTTPTITEITDTTLIKQLNNISNNIRTFEGGTNISSTSAGANPIINITTFNKLS